MISDFKKKQKGQDANKIARIAVLTFVIFVFIFLIAVDVNIYRKRQKLNAQIDGLNKEIINIKNENEILKKNISGNNNNDYVEKVAREELGLQKRGEKVISFIMPKNNQIKPEDILQNNFIGLFGWLSKIWQQLTN